MATASPVTSKRRKRDREQIQSISAPSSARVIALPEEQRACFHYTNLQPLWKRDNRAKNSRWQGVRYVYNVAQNALSR